MKKGVLPVSTLHVWSSSSRINLRFDQNIYVVFRSQPYCNEPKTLTWILMRLESLNKIG